MKTIAFINIKGGVGKTATTVTVAHMLAEKYNKRVLVIDADPQGNTSSAYSELGMLEMLSCMLSGQAIPQKENTIENLLLDSTIDVHECIHSTAYKNLDIIPSLLTLSEAEQEVKADIKVPQQFRLLNHLRKVEDEYDYCIIDCSPSISVININALAVADSVYIPMKCDAWSGVGMCVARNLIDTVRGYNPKLKFKGCFFVQWEKEKNVAKTIREIFESTISDKLLPIFIRKSKLIEEISYMQVPLLQYDTKHKNEKYSGVTEDYIKLTEWLLEHE